MVDILEASQQGQQQYGADAGCRVLDGCTLAQPDKYE